MKLARYGLALEGWLIVLALAGTAAWMIVTGRALLAILPAALLIVALLKFRDPPRQVPADPLGVLSPVDAIVKAVDRSGEDVRVELAIAAFGTYVLRSPIEGKVLESGAARGGHGMRIRTDEDDEIYLRLSGPAWLAPESVLDYGERVGQGQRYGILRGARRAELWLPADATIVVHRGDRVVAGESVLGRFHGNGAAA